MIEYPYAKNAYDDLVNSTVCSEWLKEGNSVTSSPSETAGIINGHFYNTGDLKDNKIINPWNTIEVIDYSPFKLHDITFA